MHTQHSADPPDRKHCLDCDYILDGLDINRCPECGREFNPSDWTTYSCNRLKQRTVTQWLARASKSGHIGIFSFVVAVGLSQITVARGSILDSAFLLFVQFGAWTLTVVALTMSLVATYQAAFHIRGRRYATGHVAIGLFLLPFLFISIFILPIMLNGDMRRAFPVSETP